MKVKATRVVCMLYRGSTAVFWGWIRNYRRVLAVLRGLFGIGMSGGKKVNVYAREVERYLSVPDEDG